MTYKKTAKLRFYLFLGVLLTLSTIISCRKDSRPQNTVSDPVVNAAKSWYEENFSSSQVSSKTIESINSGIDFSKKLKPYWKQGVSYTREKSEVVEVPIDPSNKLLMGLKNKSTNQIPYKAENTIASFLLIKDTSSTYNAYVMVIMGDSSYLGNDKSRLERNKYNHRDANFSGLVMYFTPDGKLLNGWRYINGNLITSGTSSTKTLQSITDNKVKPLYDAPECWDYYEVGYTNGVVDSETYLFTICNSTGGGSGGGSGGAPSTSPYIPPQCSVPVGMSLNIGVNNVPPDGGDGTGGFPPPTNLCPTYKAPKLPPADPTFQDITDNVTNPCLKDIIESLSYQSDLKNAVTSSLRNNFSVYNTLNLTFSEQTLTGANANASAITDGYGSASAQLYLEIKFNSPQLASSSREYLAETTMHEIFHAVLDMYPNLRANLSQHLYMAQNYITSEVTALKQMFPLLSQNDALCIALGGYGDLQSADPTAFQAVLTSYGLTTSQVATINGQYKNGTIGSKCK